VLAPLGWPIQDLGVLPQICTSLGAATLARAFDDLAAGKRPLAAALAAHRTTRAPVPPAIILEIRGACPAALGTDADLDAAHYLLTHPTAYANALLPPQFLPATP
jgi:carboxyl-terminal processing protease